MHVQQTVCATFKLVNGFIVYAVLTAGEVQALLCVSLVINVDDWPQEITIL